MRHALLRGLLVAGLLALMLVPVFAQETPESPDETLRRAYEAMKQAERRLAGGDAGQTTQAEQEQALALLNRLLEQEQQKQGECSECQGGQGEGQKPGDQAGQKPGNQPGNKPGNQPGDGQQPGQSQGPANGQNPGSPAAQSSTPGGDGHPGNLDDAANSSPDTGQEWGNLRPKDREAVRQALGERFSPEYMELLRQYFRQLARGRLPDRTSGE